MSWRTINLHGAAAIARVCGLYEITDTRIPGAKFKIKVLERGAGDFIGIPNVCLKAPDGSPDGICGLGRTETDALQDALKWFMAALAKRETCTPEDFEWGDPLDF